MIIAAPSYAYHVPARVKNLLDRLAYMFHRPRFFGKPFTAIVTQGVPVGDDVRKYIEECGANLGFNVTKGCRIWALDPMTEGQRRKLEQKIKKCSQRFHKALVRSPVPSIFRLMMFRTGRKGFQHASAKYYDYYYYRDKGWFESDYYYETSLGPIKKLLGWMFDFLGRQVARLM